MKVIKSEGAVLVKSVQPIENIYYTVNKWMSRKGVGEWSRSILLATFTNHVSG
jgi:hypothetical protein